MDSTYTLTIIDAPASFDFDFFMFKLLKLPEAEIFFEKDGTGTRNDGSWYEMEKEMRAFSKEWPGVLIYIHERWRYEDSGETRHYFRDGQYKLIEPVMEWPEFGAVEWHD